MDMGNGRQKTSVVVSPKSNAGEAGASSPRMARAAGPPGHERVLPEVVVDAVALIHAQENLAAKVGELVRSNSELERFASLAAHDLLSPLITMNYNAERLCNE